MKAISKVIINVTKQYVCSRKFEGAKRQLLIMRIRGSFVSFSAHQLGCSHNLLGKGGHRQFAGMARVSI